MPATKTHQHAPSTKTECDYLNGWIKKKKKQNNNNNNNKTVLILKNLSQKGEPQRYSWGTQKKSRIELFSSKLAKIG